MNKARVMYFKLGDSYSFELAEVAEKRLADLCTLIGCDLVERVYFTVRGVEYTLWRGKKSLLKPKNPVGTMFLGNIKRGMGEFTVIRGNFVVCRYKGFYNKEGDYDEKIVSLTDGEIADIRAFIDEGQIKPKLAFASGLIRRNRQYSQQEVKRECPIYTLWYTPLFPFPKKSGEKKLIIKPLYIL